IVVNRAVEGDFRVIGLKRGIESAGGCADGDAERATAACLSRRVLRADNGNSQHEKGDSYKKCNVANCSIRHCCLHCAKDQTKYESTNGTVRTGKCWIAQA